MGVYADKAIRKLQKPETRSKWVNAIKSSSSFDDYAKNLADALSREGVPISPETIKASAPGVNWKDFQANAEKYADIMISRAIEGFRSGKWAKNLARAYGSA